MKKYSMSDERLPPLSSSKCGTERGARGDQHAAPSLDRLCLVVPADKGPVTGDLDILRDRNSEHDKSSSDLLKYKTNPQLTRYSGTGRT